MRRGLLAVLGLLAAALAGCVPQDPDDVFYYLGRVTDIAATPRGGTAVSLWRSRSRYCDGSERPIFRVDLEPGSTSPPALEPPYERLRDATTREDGQFYFDLMRFEISGAQGVQRCFALVSEGAGGARTRAVIFGAEKDVDFPDLEIWDGLTLAPVAGTPARLSLPRLPWPPSAEPTEENPGNPALGVAYDWLITQATGELIWRERASTDLVLRPELLEDFPAPEASLQAWISRTVVRQTGPFATPDATTFRITVQAPARAVAGGVIPSSRGAACTVNGTALPGCPLTDGSLALATLPTHLLEPRDPFGPPPPPDEVVLELSQPILPRGMVIRDLHGLTGWTSVRIEGSLDGTTWIPHSPDPVFTFNPLAGLPDMSGFLGTGTHFASPLDFGGQPIQRIRLTSQEYTSFLAAREISVFE